MRRPARQASRKEDCGPARRYVVVTGGSPQYELVRRTCFGVASGWRGDLIGKPNVGALPLHRPVRGSRLRCPDVPVRVVEPVRDPGAGQLERAPRAGATTWQLGCESILF